MAKMTKQGLVKKVLAAMTKDKWTKKASARDKWRHEVYWGSDRAVRLCASGWCNRIANANNNYDLSGEVSRDFYDKYDNYIAYINDDNGYDAIVEKLKYLY